MSPSASSEPSIKQVASAAGVSHITVSRVLNDFSGIKLATRQRVLDVVQELEYRPNLAARALVAQRTKRIGVLVESAVEFGPSSTVGSSYYRDSRGLACGDDRRILRRPSLPLTGLSSLGDPHCLGGGLWLIRCFLCRRRDVPRHNRKSARLRAHAS